MILSTYIQPFCHVPFCRATPGPKMPIWIPSILLPLLLIVAINLAGNAWAKNQVKRPSRQHQVFFSGTEDELSVYRVYGAKPGKTMMLIGGIQGDEPGGFLSADLYADISLAQGNLIVVPRANFYSIILKHRGPDGDMNRQFGDPVTARRHKKIIKILKKLISESDILLNLHEGSGYYRPKWEGPMANPDRYGQCLIADTDVYTKPDGSKLDLAAMAARVLKKVNPSIKNKKYRLLFNNHRTARSDSHHKEQRRSATYYALSNWHIPAFGVETSKSLPNNSIKVHHHTLVINAFMEELGIVPVNPATLLEKPRLEFLVISVNDNLPVVVTNRGALTINKGDRVKVVHVEANYERGLSCDIDGLGTLNDKRRSFVINNPTSITVRKDSYTIGRVHVKIARSEQAYTTLRSQLMYFLVEVADGERRVVASGETLEVVKGDKIKLVDLISNLPGQHSLKVNFKGYVPPGANANSGEDRGYSIDTARELMQRYSQCDSGDKGGECYRVVASRGNQTVGSFNVKISPARLDYMVLRRQDGHKLVYYSGETIEAKPGERLEVVDLKTNCGYSKDLALALRYQGKQFDLKDSTIDTAQQKLKSLLNNGSENVKLVVLRAGQNIGHVRLTTGDK